MPSYHWQGCDTPQRLLPLQCDLSSSDCLNASYIHQLCMPLPSLPLTRTNTKKYKFPTIQIRGIFFWGFLWCVAVTVTFKFWRGSFTWAPQVQLQHLSIQQCMDWLHLITVNLRLVSCWNNDKNSFSQILIGAKMAAVVWTCLERALGHGSANEMTSKTGSHLHIISEIVILFSICLLSNLAGIPRDVSLNQVFITKSERIIISRLSFHSFFSAFSHVLTKLGLRN